MRYGFSIPNRGPLARPEEITAIAQRGDQLGYYSMASGDHILVPNAIDSRYPYTESGEFPGSPSGESMEMITLLAYLAGRTENIRLVCGVLIVPHRNPLVAAKALATLDVVSNGRLIIGIGVGWMREEFEALGIPPFEERGAVTDEYILAMKELWSSDRPSFQGKYCSFSNISFLPKPVQKPHPPIWVGGESTPALRRTGRTANAWHPLGTNPDFPMGTLDQLKEAMCRIAGYAEQAGRDPYEIEVIYRPPTIDIQDSPIDGDRALFTGSPEQIAGDVRAYQDIGVAQLTFDMVRWATSVSEATDKMEALATRVWPLV